MQDAARGGDGSKRVMAGHDGGNETPPEAFARLGLTSLDNGRDPAAAK